jgi:hypothetical protein
MTSYKGLLSIFATFALLLFQGVASAQNAHFVGTPKASLTEDFAAEPAETVKDDLAVAFKEAGLGDNEQITYSVTATASGSCACVTNSGNCPAAANKFPPTGVSNTGTFNSGKNGTISQTINVEEPDCQQVTNATCPPGQTNTLVSLSYSNVAIEDTTTTVGPVTTSPSSITVTGLTTCQ